MQPPEGDARALLHKQQIMSIKAVEEALANKAPTERAQENRGRRLQLVTIMAKYQMKPIGLRSSYPTSIFFVRCLCEKKINIQCDYYSVDAAVCWLEAGYASTRSSKYFTFKHTQ